MQIEKKQILKEDGRYLVFYHFAETATPEQTAVFAAVPAQMPSEASSGYAPSPQSGLKSEDSPRV